MFGNWKYLPAHERRSVCGAVPFHTTEKRGLRATGDVSAARTVFRRTRARCLRPAGGHSDKETESQARDRPLTGRGRGGSSVTTATPSPTSSPRASDKHIHTVGPRYLSGSILVP
ncbi:hypothetical protein J4Q44_G00201980 [Coregonus suidteri]|uniref:Uncharacterized protein n=1 Tax=Coregonus suidteri TaxID=861788 RepID=A0AAN8QM89_9TELE